MDSKDPPPFGYTFDDTFLTTEATPFTNGSHPPPLLNDNESQSLFDFFNQDPFATDPAPFSSHIDAKTAADDFASWDFVPPPSVHQISTTIPDQAQLHRGFSTDHAFAPGALSAGPFPTTPDDLQAASTLFNNAQANAQASLTNGRSYSVPSVHNSHPTHSLPISSAATPAMLGAVTFGLPNVATTHGPLNEQLASMLPKHSERGSVDSQIAAQFSHLQQTHAPELAQLAQIERPPRPQLKRSYTYGTDSAFNPTGYIPPSPNAEDAVTQRLLYSLHNVAKPVESSPTRPATNGRKLSSTTDHTNYGLSLIDVHSDGDEQSEDDTSNDDDDARPNKKRRKSTAAPPKDKSSSNHRKSISNGRGATTKNRKGSVDDSSTKKKRNSSAGQKAQRENLSEEQKRNNHILSEQKRRNLIKRGFDDLHDLVPEIRNGGLSKSSVLMEAATFLEKIIEDNQRYLSLLGTAKG